MKSNPVDNPLVPIQFDYTGSSCSSFVEEILHLAVGGYAPRIGGGGKLGGGLKYNTPRYMMCLGGCIDWMGDWNYGKVYSSGHLTSS